MIITDKQAWRAIVDQCREEIPGDLQFEQLREAYPEPTDGVFLSEEFLLQALEADVMAVNEVERLHERSQRDRLLLSKTDKSKLKAELQLARDHVRRLEHDLELVNLAEWRLEQAEWLPRRRMEEAPRVFGEFELENDAVRPLPPPPRKRRKRRKEDPDE